MAIEALERVDFLLPQRRQDGDVMGRNELLGGVRLRLQTNTALIFLLDIFNAPSDRISLWANGIQTRGAEPLAAQYPIQFVWELRGGMGCSQDLALAVAGGITNVKSAAEVAGAGATARDGKMFEVVNSVDRWGLYGRIVPVVGVPNFDFNVVVYARLEKLGMAAGPPATVGSFIG